MMQTVMIPVEYEIFSAPEYNKRLNAQFIIQ